MKIRQVPFEDVKYQCSWCGVDVPDHHPVLSLDCKKWPWIDLSAFEGGAIEIPFMMTRPRIAFVSSRDSDAKRDGCDFRGMRDHDEVRVACRENDP